MKIVRLYLCHLNKPPPQIINLAQSKINLQLEKKKKKRNIHLQKRGFEITLSGIFFVMLQERFP